MEDIIGFDALYDSMKKCQRGVIWKDSVAHYTLNALEETMKLENQLKNGTYEPRPTRKFTITSPKPRNVISVSFRDRVYQRSLNDNSIYPDITKHFIYDNWACQKGKGTDAARNRLKEFLRYYYRRHGQIGYVSQFDIHGYYPNMPHELAEGVFERYLKPEVYERAKDVLSGQYEGERGYNPGSQMVQIAGISVLNDIDHFIKERLHAKLYIRYMDDFIIIHHNEDELRETTKIISEKLIGMGLELNDKKTRIYPLSEGIMFLGFKFSVTNTGKVLMIVDPKRIKAARRKYRRLARKVKKGLATRACVDMSYQSFRENVSKGNSYKLLQRLDEFYERLW